MVGRASEHQRGVADDHRGVAQGLEAPRDGRAANDLENLPTSLFERGPERYCTFLGLSGVAGNICRFEAVRPLPTQYVEHSRQTGGLLFVGFTAEK
jgi:hypothetical protein